MVDVTMVVEVDEEVASTVAKAVMKDILRTSSSPLFHLCYLHLLRSTPPFCVRSAISMDTQQECAMKDATLLMLLLLKI